MHNHEVERHDRKILVFLLFRSSRFIANNYRFDRSGCESDTSTLETHHHHHRDFLTLSPTTMEVSEQTRRKHNAYEALGPPVRQWMDFFSLWSPLFTDSKTSGRRWANVLLWCSIKGTDDTVQLWHFVFSWTRKKTHVEKLASDPSCQLDSDDNSDVVTKTLVL